MIKHDPEDLKELSVLTREIHETLGVHVAEMLFQTKLPTREGIDAVNEKIIEWHTRYETRDPILYLAILRNTANLKEQLSNWNWLRDITNQKFIDLEGEDQARRIMRGLMG